MKGSAFERECASKRESVRREGECASDNVCE